PAPTAKGAKPRWNPGFASALRMQDQNQTVLHQLILDRKPGIENEPLLRRDLKTNLSRNDKRQASGE
ncbi:MAG: hypothetical protein IJ041_08415, partial [Clostridia bacterium]|nr:hypothetical protein [Clostridia bacterium]